MYVCVQHDDELCRLNVIVGCANAKNGDRQFELLSKMFFTVTIEACFVFRHCVRFIDLAVLHFASELCMCVYMSTIQPNMASIVLFDSMLRLVSHTYLTSCSEIMWQLVECI